MFELQVVEQIGHQMVQIPPQQICINLCIPGDLYAVPADRNK